MRRGGMNGRGARERPRREARAEGDGEIFVEQDPPRLDLRRQYHIATSDW